MDLYNLPLEDKRASHFTPMWTVVSEACNSAFAILQVRPEGDLTEAYRALQEKLCIAHALVYRLTAIPCVNCPSLVRGTNSQRVYGDKPESTQVLVVYYLLREMLRRQLVAVKATIEQSTDVINAYINGFEHFTAGVNLIKPVFTYLHWVWQKRGLPPEHIILPTEVVALHLWAELVLDVTLRDSLIRKVDGIVQKMRAGEDVALAAMESVKRLSLNLLILHDIRQGSYNLLVEHPYLERLKSHYEELRGNFKTVGPEEYIVLCDQVVKLEEQHARYLLAGVSYDKVRTCIIDTLIDAERDFLYGCVKDLLTLTHTALLPRQRDCLAVLHEMLGGSTQRCWVHDVLRNNVVKHALDAIALFSSEVWDEESAAAVLQVLRQTYTNYKALLTGVFGARTLPVAAMLEGIRNVLTMCGEMHKANGGRFNDCLARALAMCAASEVESGGGHEAAACRADSPAWIVDLFELLESKDVFYAHYTRLLEQRLLKAVAVIAVGASGATEHALRREEKMLGDLFTKHRNFDFVYSCQRMLRDVYRRPLHWQEMPPLHGDYELQPIVLTKFIWGGLLAPATKETAALPGHVQQRMLSFAARFTSSPLGAGRRLTFLSAYSAGVLRMSVATTSGGADRGCVRLVVSSRQMVLALAFNRKRVWDLVELALEAGMSVEQCITTLGPLLAAHVVEFVDAGRQSVCLGRVGGMTSGRLVLAPEVHLDLQIAAHAAEGTRSATLTEKEKSYAVEACIVHYLKSSGPRSMDEIYGRACERLMGFGLQRRDVKRVLEKLSEREYITRNMETQTFSYAP